MNVTKKIIIGNRWNKFHYSVLLTATTAMALTVGKCMCVFVCVFFALVFAIIKSNWKSYFAQFHPVYRRFAIVLLWFMVGWCRVTRNVKLTKRRGIRWHFQCSSLARMKGKSINFHMMTDTERKSQRIRHGWLHDVPGKNPKWMSNDENKQMREKRACSWVVSLHVKRTLLIHKYGTHWFGYRIKWNVATILIFCDSILRYTTTTTNGTKLLFDSTHSIVIAILLSF